MKQRWYDKNPTVSLAISLLKNSDEDTKKYCSEHIIEVAKTNNIKISNGFFSKLNTAFKRWYDEDKTLADAMEYLRLSPEPLRKKIAIEIIEILEQAQAK